MGHFGVSKQSKSNLRVAFAAVLYALSCDAAA